MNIASRDRGLTFPFPEPPAPGEMIEVAPGVLWARVALPFRLDHVNIFFIEDGEGWAVLDTGINNEATRAAWESLVAGASAAKPLTRLIVTHFHPDHIGLAGWLAERFDLPLFTSQTAYLGCWNISLSPGRARCRALPALLRAQRPRCRARRRSSARKATAICGWSRRCRRHSRASSPAT